MRSPLITLASWQLGEVWPWLLLFFQFYRWEEHPFGELKEKLNKVPLLLGSAGYHQLQNAKAKTILVHWTILTATTVHAHHSMLREEDTSLITQLVHTVEGISRVGPANVLFSPLLPSSYSPFLSHKLLLKMPWRIKFLQFSDLAFQGILRTERDKRQVLW